MNDSKLLYPKLLSSQIALQSKTAIVSELSVLGKLIHVPVAGAKSLDRMALNIMKVPFRV